MTARDLRFDRTFPGHRRNLRRACLLGESENAEIGIRIALGGQHWSMRLVVGHALKLALLGVAIGIASYAATRVMATVPVGVTARDALMFATVSLDVRRLAGRLHSREARFPV